MREGKVIARLQRAGVGIGIGIGIGIGAKRKP